MWQKSYTRKCVVFLLKKEGHVCPHTAYVSCVVSVCAHYFAEHPVVAELLTLDVAVVQLVHIAQVVAGQDVDVDDVVGAAEHPDVTVVVDGVDVGAFAEQPCATEDVVVVAVVAAVVVVAVVVAVELEDICATTPTIPNTDRATTAATTKIVTFFIAEPPFFS